MYHSCSEDYHHAEFLPTEKEKEDFYINIKSAAESGWDFSSRWFIANGTNAGKIKELYRFTNMSKKSVLFHRTRKEYVTFRNKISALESNYFYGVSVYLFQLVFQLSKT